MQLINPFKIQTQLPYHCTISSFRTSELSAEARCQEGAAQPWYQTRVPLQVMPADERTMPFYNLPSADSVTPASSQSAVQFINSQLCSCTKCVSSFTSCKYPTAYYLLYQLNTASHKVTFSSQILCEYGIHSYKWVIYSCECGIHLHVNT